MHSMILGATPIRTKSRRRLFRTPSTSTPITPAPVRASTPASAVVAAPAPAPANAITIESKPGTLIQHAEITGNARSNQLGVIVSKNVTDANKLDVLWTTDGTTEPMAPAFLNAYDITATNEAAQAPATTSGRTAAAVQLQPELQQQYARSYRSIVMDKFPKTLVCPLDSVDEEEVSNYQMALNNYVCAAHPRMRQLITGDLWPPLLAFKPYQDYM